MDIYNIKETHSINGRHYHSICIDGNNLTITLKNK